MKELNQNEKKQEDIFSGDDKEMMMRDDNFVTTMWLTEFLHTESHRLQNN